MARKNQVEKPTIVPTSSRDSPMPCNRQQPPEISSEPVSNENCVFPATNPPLTREQLIYDQQLDPKLQTIA